MGEVPAKAADVVVIGAGFAGLSAAVRLAEAGLSVVVAEEAPRLGGRATAFTDRESGERVDNGQHVLFGCYRETYTFLRRLGTDGLAPLQPRLSIAFADTTGRSARLSCPPWPPPWHLMGGVLSWSALPVRDRLGALKLAGFLRRVRRDGAEAVAGRVAADQTVSGWLEAHGQRAELCEWLWNPLALAALNQSPEAAAAGAFVRVLGELFGPRLEDSAIGLSKVPLDELYAEPARRYLEQRGGQVVQRASARIRLDEDGSISHVAVGDARVATRTVVSTVPWHALARLWDAKPPAALIEVIDRASSMASSPIVTVNLWFDGRVGTDPFVGLVGGPMHWVFDKQAIFGGQAGHLSVVASGASDLVVMDNAAATDVAVRHLRQALPGMESRRLRRSVVVREPRATFSLAPGEPARPASVTRLAGFYLAGDWVGTALPGTIEAAVVSGHRAADLILARDAQRRSGGDA
jgi:squalene-associated FAD-dependent desaturase